MFQVLVTIFFSAAVLAAGGVIVAMLTDNATDIARALGFVAAPVTPSPPVGIRRPAVVRVVTPRFSAASPLRAAA